MSAELFKFPTHAKPRSKTVTAAELYAEPLPGDEMVWEMCRYTRMADGCRGCPHTQSDAEYGEVQLGCRGLAEEASRLAAIMLRRAALQDKQPK